MGTRRQCSRTESGASTICAPGTPRASPRSCFGHRPWLPARLELWRAPDTAQEFAEQVRREGRCFLRTAELIDIARRLGLMLPDARGETVVRVLCAWAAESCLEHVRSQLHGLVLYAVVPSSAARRLCVVTREPANPRVSQYLEQHLANSTTLASH